MTSSSHKIILTSSPDGPIIAYDGSTGNPLANFTGSRSPRRGIAVLGDTYIAVSHVSSDSVAGSIHLYNWYTSTAFHNIPVPEPVAPLAATPDGCYLLAGGLSGSVHALSMPTGDILMSFPVHKRPITCLQLNNDGSLVISGSDDGTIFVIPIFQFVEESEVENPCNYTSHELVAHSNSVTAIATGIGMADSTFISCSLDCTCKCWSLIQGTLLRTVAFPCSIFDVALDLTEWEFYAAGSDGLIYKVPMKTGSRQLRNPGHETLNKKHDAPIVSLRIVNEGESLVSAADDGSVWLWDIESGEVILVLGNGMGSISDMMVAKGVCNGNGSKNGRVTGIAEIQSFIARLSEKELFRPVRETREIEELMTLAANDRRRAIDTLESAIEMYEKLLELILEEAKVETSSSNEKVKMTTN